MLKSLFDTFVPYEIKKTPLAYSHAKNIIRAAIITLIATPIYAMIYHVLDFHLASYVIIALGVLILMAALSLPFTKSLRFTRIMMISPLAVCITWISYRMGGICSPATYWLVLPPLLAIFFGGIREGILWALYCVGATLWMYLLQYNHILLPTSPIINITFLQTFSTVGLLFIILSLAYLFEIGKREYTAEIEITNEKLYAAKIEADKSAQHASEANRAKSTFLATMSHEIRTPLNGVLGMIGILIETPLTQEQYKQAEIIRSSGEALLAIINNILDFSKIESERLELEETNFDIYAVINNIIKMISAQIPCKNLAIISAIEPSTPRWLKGDCNRIGQVLNNLLMNAAKFTEVGEIRTSVRLLSQKNREITLLFEIIDTGIGITPAICERLFKPFSQGDASVSRKYGGTGLGLVISKRLIEMMGGKIGVESLPGYGSKFWFTIPLTLGEQVLTVSKEKIATLSKEDKNNFRILLVEDNSINLQVLSRILKNLGYQTDAYNNGSEALSAVKNKAYNLILLDCEMPVMDGYVMAQKVRAHEQNKKLHIPIIALTAHAVLGDREKCLAAGMDDYLTKPIDIKMLALTMDKWLS